jgi:transcriptional regulator with XRE-family HTH domain
VSLRDLSDKTGLDRGYLSRLERGLVRRPAAQRMALIAEALEVSPDSIDTPGDAVTAPTVSAKRRPRSTEIRPNLPNPASVEGELFAYTPAETSQWVPLSPRELRERAYRRELEHGNTGRQIFFTGLHIRAALKALTVPASTPAPRRKSP